MKNCNIHEKLPVNKSYGNIELLDINKIVFIWSDRNYINYVLSNGRIVEERRTLASLERQLDSYGFIRIYKRTIVNMRYIKEMDLRKNYILLQTGQKLEIGRNFKGITGSRYYNFLKL